MTLGSIVPERYLSPLIAPENKKHFMTCLKRQAMWLLEHDGEKLSEEIKTLIMHLAATILCEMEGEYYSTDLPVFFDAKGQQHLVSTSRLSHDISTDFCRIAHTKNYAGLKELAVKIVDYYFHRQSRKGKALYVYTPLIVWYLIPDPLEPTRKYGLVTRGKLI